MPAAESALATEHAGPGRCTVEPLQGLRLRCLRFVAPQRFDGHATLRKLGGTVKELSDGHEIEGTLGAGPSILHEAIIDSWGDHRIAMAFSVAALVVPGIVIEKPQVVSKSFPAFFEVLKSLGARVEFVDQQGREVLS